MPLRPGTGRYPELTAVRGLAALAVVGTHAAYWTGRYDESTLGLVLARLDVGVAVFFALSGFLLLRPWLAAAAGAGTPPSARSYAWARATRILPGYLVAVAAAYLFVASPSGNGLGDLVRTLTLTQIYPGAEQHLGLTQMWSLAVEVSFYLVLPVLAPLLARLRSTRARLTVLGGLGAVSPLWWVLRARWDAPLEAQYWLPGHLVWFVAGMALCVLAVEREATGSADLPGAARAPGSVWLVGAGLFLVASTPAAGPATLVPAQAGAATLKSLLYAGVAACVLAPLVARSASPLVTWLRHPALQWLGRVSYELFLVHLVVIEGVMDVLGYRTFTGDTAVVFVVTLLASLAVAAPLHLVLARLTGRGGGAAPGSGRRRRDRAAGPPGPARHAARTPTGPRP
ncbi:acyltransferase [Phycicoccus sp. MAQZ13P-2]|uniref:acyltransferase family protein n=1 Tax=Phycicoccus mangrovi TaxID=2840470 RepID=UPI001C006B5A|nr:acyltransferase [Phycicoccus mangrovi]MBT9257024.1 acyltransferase [Phycicoccus mangrovi]MBT9275486.1 acyltransferase [Phycicoccus mangrovi]